MLFFRLILNHNNLSVSRKNEDINFHHPRVFSNLINLMELHLTNTFADNTSSQLSEDLHDYFVNSNLTQLKKLHLEQNEISKFKDKKVFCDLPNLMDLHLGDNLLEGLNFNINCLKKLRFLDLERNQFTMLKARDLNALDELAKSRKHVNLTVDFWDNPFTCNCSINFFKQWLGISNVNVRNVAELSCTKKGRKNYIIDVALTCKVNSHKNSTTSTHKAILIFLLVVLTCILIGLVSLLIHLSKDKIKFIISPAFAKVTKKVHYSSITDDDPVEQYV